MLKTNRSDCPMWGEYFIRIGSQDSRLMISENIADDYVQILWHIVGVG